MASISGSSSPLGSPWNNPPKTAADLVRAVQTRNADVTARKQAKRSEDYACRRGKRHAKPREGEKPENFAKRRKHWSYVAAFVVDRLTAALYGRPPRRSWEPSSPFLESVWTANQADYLMAAVDRAALVGGVAAIQVDIVDAEDSPSKLWLYKRHEFTVWCKPDDPTTPWAVATFSNTDESATLWTENTVWSFTAKDKRDSELKVSSKPNPYGRLPFAFAPTRPQIDEFFVAGLGEALADLNSMLDEAQNDLAQAFAEYAIPMAISANIAPTTQIERRPGSIQALGVTDAVGLAERGKASIEFVAPTIQWEQLTNSLKRLRDDTLRELCPDTLLQGSASASSGIQLLVAQAELVAYVNERRMLASVWEQAIADVVRECEGAINRPVPASRLSLSWPRRVVPVDLPDFQQMDQSDLQAGLTSRVAIYQDRHGLTREQALDALAEIQADNEADQPPEPEGAPPDVQG